MSPQTLHNNGEEEGNGLKIKKQIRNRVDTYNM